MLHYKDFSFFSHIKRWMKQVFSYRKNKSEIDFTSKESAKLNLDHWSDEVVLSKSESMANELKQRLFPTQSSSYKASLQKNVWFCVWIFVLLLLLFFIINQYHTSGQKSFIFFRKILNITNCFSNTQSY